MKTIDAAPGSSASGLAYPAVLIGGLVLHLTLVRAGLPLELAAYSAVALGAAAVAILERLLPARAAWRPTFEDIRVDAAYMVLVQAALPVVLGLAAASWIRALSGELALPRLWPHDAPVALQVLLMLLAADLLRYGLHVAAHRNALLWCLHRVHHRPEKLYWLNVGRFHPAEKTLQYLLDAAPFALLGVSDDVLALYLVVYALNGFFQHSNVDVRLGPLNYVVSGPELHRWHHSSRPEESATNFGNNLIVWDLVFGTRFLPEGRKVGRLGVDDDPPRASVVAALFRLKMAITGATTWRGFVRACRRPRHSQERVLLDILERNRDTRFGREHRFGEIASVEDFRRNVPVQSYETLRPYVEEQLRAGSPALTAVPPVLYARTSGTTSEPKLVPVLRETLEGLRRRQLLATHALHRAAPGAYRGRILAVVGAAVEEELPGAAAVGSASGHLYETMPALARRKYVLPPEVFRVRDYELKYRLMARLALAEKDITLMGAANPATFLRLLEVVRERRRELLADVEGEGFSGLDGLDEDVRRSVAPRLRCSSRRKAELRALLARDDFRLRDLWPRLKALATWTGGSAGFFLDRLRPELPEAALVCELGYLASELAGTVELDPRSGLAVPMLEDHFFELADKESYEAGDPRFRALDEVDVGREYYVVVTTRAGLYRYFMNDIVRVTGWFHGAPALAFVQKGSGVTSITGEKLYEGQVLEAMRRTEAALGLETRFFVLLADVGASRYRLVVEPVDAGGVDTGALADELDRSLARGNIEYREKRASGRLRPLEVRILGRGAGEAYKRECLRRGQRESQFKVLTLQYAHDFRFQKVALAS